MGSSNDIPLALILLLDGRLEEALEEGRDDEVRRLDSSVCFEDDLHTSERQLSRS